MPASPQTRRKAFVTQRGDGLPIHVVGDEVTVKISSHATGGAFAVFESQVRPLHGPPLHVHNTQDESWYVLDGEFLFEVDGREIYARTGDTVFAARGTCHAFQNIGTTTGRMLTTVVPGGLDVFFEELERVTVPGVEPDPARMAPLFAKHGLELAGPPLAARLVTSAACGAD
jgi:quercetin dioxygenase-like cupin family protein